MEKGVVADKIILNRYRFLIQSMRCWCHEYFESEDARVMFGTFAAFVKLFPDDAGRKILILPFFQYNTR
ncbi:MAG TPA: hypothetical protein VJ767_11110 [Nitrososphaeraceae archaeon]|nr:hypothetical protein [Nitrososphaeraceae archaeon]